VCLQQIVLGGMDKFGKVSEWGNCLLAADCVRGIR